MMRCTPKTSCSPAATRNSTAAWNSPLRTTLVAAPTTTSHFPAVDPLVELHAGRLLELGGVHHLHRINGGEVVLVLVGRETLVEVAVRDVVLAVAERPAEALDLQPLESLDDLVRVRPLAADRLGCLLDRALVGGDGGVRAVGLEV